MPSFRRLKWIPMVFQAYHEALMRADASAQRRGGEPAADRNVGPGRDMHAASPPLPQQTPSKPASRARAAKALARRSNHSMQRTTVKWGHPADRQSYSSVLQELRETRQKLTCLESINQQLTQMQQRLESEFEEIRDLVKAKDTPVPLGNPESDVHRPDHGLL